MFLSHYFKKMRSLDDIIYDYVITVLGESDRYTTIETIKWRILRQCADILNLDFNTYINKDLIYIHKDNMNTIDVKWESLLNNDTKIVHTEQNAYKIIKFSDYLNILDVKKFIMKFKVILARQNKIKKVDNFLYALLAMDGVQGYNINNYIGNLKFGKDSNHVRVIREIYKTFDISVKVVHLALLNVYETFVVNDEIKQNLKDIKRILENEMLVNENVLNNVINFYKDNIENLENIATFKLLQLKKSKTRKIEKRVLEENHKPRHRKILKVRFIE